MPATGVVYRYPFISASSWGTHHRTDTQIVLRPNETDIAPSSIVSSLDLTPPEQTAEGIQMFAVCSKKESKTDAPGLKEVRDKMFEKKFGAKANRYLADLRRQAMIEYK